MPGEMSIEKDYVMKLMRFYKLYDWILEELGASTDAALIAVIYSFEERRQVCALSYTDFSEILKVNRRKAITRISNLENAGYITVKKHTTQTNVYTVNRSAFQTSDQNGTSASDQNGTSYISTSDQNGTSASDQNGTSASDQNGTPTIRENKRDIRERERENPHDSTSDFILIPNHEAVKLTAPQYEMLQSEVHGTGRTLESYLRSLESSMKRNGKSYEPHNETLRDWIQRDKDERADKAAQQTSGTQPKHSSINMRDIDKIYRQQSSIDLDDVAKLVNRFD